MSSAVAESPQALAQLARDISDLVRTARAEPHDAAKSHVRASSPGVGSRAVAAPAIPPVGRISVLESEHDALQREVADLRQRWAGLDSGLPTTIGSPRFDGLSTPGVSVGGGQNNSSFVFPGVPRPLDVSSLLASIESREWALRTQVRQLAEEKSSQQRQMEEEIASLQRANNSMREALCERQQRAPVVVEEEVPDAEQASTVFRESPLSRSTSTHGARSSSEKHSDWLPSALSASAPVSQIATGENASRMSQDAAPRGVTEADSVPTALAAPSSPREAREAFRRQLSEVRGEVSRCAEILGLSKSTLEQDDVRQQLSTLSDEVMRTSRSLLDAGQPLGQRNTEIAGIRRQLNFLQGRGSLEHRGSPPVNPRPADVSDLRMEVNCLRAELAQFGVLPLHVMSDVRAQIEALRSDLSDVVQQVPMYTPGSRFSRFPANAIALKDRLSDLKTEVARMLQDPFLEGGMASPEARARLGTLLRELQELRAGAVSVASAAEDSFGTSFVPTSTWDYRVPSVACAWPHSTAWHGSPMCPAAPGIATRPPPSAALRGFSAPVGIARRPVRTDREFMGGPRSLAGVRDMLAAPQMLLSDMVQSSPADEPEDHLPSPTMQPPSRSRLVAVVAAPLGGAQVGLEPATVGGASSGRVPPGRRQIAGQNAR